MAASMMLIRLDSGDHVCLFIAPQQALISPDMYPTDLLFAVNSSFLTFFLDLC